MPSLVLANEATAAKRRVFFQLYDATDGITAETGEAGGQPQVSSDGAAFTNTGIGTLTHAGNGRYSADLTQTVVATAGTQIETRYKSAATAETPGTSVQVVAFDPYSTSLGLLLAAANLSADTITAAKVAADVTTEIQAGLATSAALTTAQADLDDIQTRLPAALVGGRIDANIGAISTDATAADALESILDGGGGTITANVTGNLSGSVGSVTGAVGSVTGAVGSVTGNVGGNVAGSVGSVATGGIVAASFGAGAIDNAAIATDAIGSAELAASAVNEIADQVWDESMLAHVGSGSAGEAMNFIDNIFGLLNTLYPAIVAAGGEVQAGTTTTNVLTDILGLDDYYNGMTLVVYDPSRDVYVSRRIVDFADTNGDFTVSPAFPFVPTTGDTCKVITPIAPTPSSTIVDEIWDESRAGHVLAGSFGEGVASVQGNVTGSVASVTGAVGSVTGNVGGNVVGTVASVVGNVGGNVVGSVGSVAANGITATSLDATASAEIADQVWDEVLAGHLTAGTTGAALNSAGSGASASVIADAVWDEARAGHVAAGSFGEGVASVQGNVTGSVASVAAGGITAASIATDAIDSDAIAASAVTEIQSGLATSASIVTLQSDTDDIQARLPATLSGGRMRSQVEGMDAGTVTAAAIATGAIDADALAADAGVEIGAAVDVTLTGTHGAGTWGGGSAPTVAQIADGVWDEALAGHLAVGSTGEALSDAAAGGAGLTEQQVANAGLLTPVGVAAPGSLIGNFDEIMGPGFNPLTDSLEEIRDEVDACCAGGGADVVDVVGT